MDVVGNHHDGLALRKDLVPLSVGGGAALEVELPFELLEMLEILERGRRGNFGDNEGILLGGGAEGPNPDPVGVLRHQLEILNDLVPAGQFPVGADPEAEILLRGRDLGRERRRDGEKKRERAYGERSSHGCP